MRRSTHYVCHMTFQILRLFSPHGLGSVYLNSLHVPFVGLPHYGRHLELLPHP